MGYFLKSIHKYLAAWVGSQCGLEFLQQYGDRRVGYPFQIPINTCIQSVKNKIDGIFLCFKARTPCSAADSVTCIDSKMVGDQRGSR